MILKIIILIQCSHFPQKSYFFMVIKNSNTTCHSSKLTLHIVKVVIFNHKMRLKYLMLQLSQGQLLEMQLLESRLLDSFFEKVICSTEKCQLLDKKKYAVRVPRVNFKQLIKKCNCSKF